MQLAHTLYDEIAGRALALAARREMNFEIRLPRPPSPVVRAIVEHAKQRPYFHLDGYMERDFNHRGDRLSTRTHKILRSDLDRDLHNHPWHYATLILEGGYWEVTPRDFDQPYALDRDDGHRVRTWYGPGNLLVRCHPRFRHRLEVPEGGYAITCFSYLAKHRDWGFFTPQGVVYWDHFDFFKSLAPAEIEKLSPDHPMMIAPTGWAYDLEYLTRRRASPEGV